MGKHKNRAMLHDTNGDFLTTLTLDEAQRLIQSSVALRLSDPSQRQLRLRLLTDAGKFWKARRSGGGPVVMQMATK